MVSYMTEKTIIDGHVIDGIEMLDNDTCCLYFEDETENDNIITTIVENGYPHYKVRDNRTGNEIHCDLNELNETISELLGV